MMNISLLVKRIILQTAVSQGVPRFSLISSGKEDTLWTVCMEDSHYMDWILCEKRELDRNELSYHIPSATGIRINDLAP